jgi:hypothetical protein
MLRTLLLTLLLIFASQNSQAQNPEDKAISKAKLQELNFLIGSWFDPGNATPGEEPPQQINMSSFRDSLAILLNGYIIEKRGERTDFLSIITYNPRKKAFEFYSLYNGQSTIFRAEYTPNQFTWFAGDHMRSTFKPDGENHLISTIEVFQYDSWNVVVDLKLQRKEE